MFSTMYIKRCPKCDDNMRYISLLDYNLSIEHNIPCDGCKPYIRQCPRCKHEIKYTGLTLYVRDIINNRPCESCIERSPIVGTFIRNCPKCNELITYNIKSKYDYAKDNNILCTGCKSIATRVKNEKKNTCKECNKVYKSLNLNGICKECKNKKNPNYIVLPQNPLDWKKTCPTCNCTMTYKDDSGYRYGISHNSKCRTCKNKKYPSLYCKDCNKKLFNNNTSGYCKKCFNTHIIRKSPTKYTYSCPICKLDIQTLDKKVYNRCKERGTCYKCTICKLPTIQFTCSECNELKYRANCDYCIFTSVYTKIKHECCSTECRNKIKERDIKNQINTIHKERYDYSKTIIDASTHHWLSTKRIITCKTHGDFLLNIGNHARGGGCQKCQISKGEYKILDYLKSNNIEFKHQKMFDDCVNPKTNRRLKYDFYIPDKNILIEFDGEQHYIIGRKVRNHILTEEEVANLKLRDEIKNEFAKSNNIKLLRIPYNKIDKIPDILDKELSTY